MNNILVSLLFVPSIVVGCMMPPAQQQQQNTAGPGPSGESGGGLDCNAYCSHETECGLAQYQPCSDYCARNVNDAYFAQQAITLTNESCDQLQARAAATQQGNGGGGGGGGGYGGDGSGCRASAANGGPAVQDCPAMQQCCSGGCHAIGYCSMPTGR